MKRYHLFEWGVFVVALIGMLAWKGLLFELGVFGWAFMGVLIVVFIIVDALVDGITRPLFVAVGLASGRGPLRITAHETGDTLSLTFENEGRGRINLALLRGFDHRGQRVLATPLPAIARFSKKHPEEDVVMSLGQKRIPGLGNTTATIDLEKLRALKCRTLDVLDADGREWPVSW